MSLLVLQPRRPRLARRRRACAHSAGNAAAATPPTLAAVASISVLLPAVLASTTAATFRSGRRRRSPRDRRRPVAPRTKHRKCGARKGRPVVADFSLRPLRDAGHSYVVPGAGVRYGGSGQLCLRVVGLVGHITSTAHTATRFELAACITQTRGHLSPEPREFWCKPLIIFVPVCRSNCG